MSKRTTKAPDAWEDDDWEVQADKAELQEPESEPETQAPISKAERLAQHAETNRKIWESAEAPPDPFHYLSARADPPLASAFKPAVKVLSRKPAGAASYDEDDETKKTPQLTPEEMQAKQQRERDEKQRRYDEARAKIFGTSTSTSTSTSNPSSGPSTPGTITPPSRSADGRGARGRGRGGPRGGGGGRYNNNNNNNNMNNNESRDRDTSNARPGSQSGSGRERELYDPNYSPKPPSHGGGERRGVNYNNDGGAPLSRRSTPREDDQIIRSPRGPDGSGRGGFGFARRGGKTS
ncbi:hypothetical protein M426DRAFT_195933 [Hypoxylon sp. CI-4A]|nr:hypothetical protein M426DRAFT_195933 [Hypoxylon sp. CI-4A]